VGGLHCSGFEHNIGKVNRGGNVNVGHGRFVSCGIGIMCLRGSIYFCAQFRNHVVVRPAAVSHISAQWSCRNR
jgi:hypothetical protein